MAPEPIRPIDHGFVSSTVETSVQTARGGILGTLKGGAEGFLTGALVLGGITAAVLLAFTGVGALGVTLSAIGAGLLGGALGGVTGAPIGAATGSIAGFRRGRNTINNERAAAQVMQTQGQIAEAQSRTADAMQAIAVASMTPPPASAPMMAGPMPGVQVSGANYFDKGVSAERQIPVADQALAHGTHHDAAAHGAHTQKLAEQALMGADAQAGR